MGLGFLKKKKEFVDWSSQCDRNQERLNNLRVQIDAIECQGKSSGKISSLLPPAGLGSSSSSQNSEESAAPFPFFSGFNSGVNAVSSVTSSATSSEENEEKRRKLANRLMQMTTQIEDISNQLYHLQQRIELVERKLGVGRGGY